MSYSSPDSYRKLLSEADKLCIKAEEIITQRTSQGFIPLIRKGQSVEVVCEMSEMIGKLKQAIRGLHQPKTAEKYQAKIQKLISLRKKLRDQLSP